MKNSLLLSLLALVFFSSSAFAQLEKGNVLIGGNAGLSATSSSNNNTNSTKSNFTYNLSPNIGYFVVKGLAVGAVLSYDHTNSSYPDLNTSLQKDIHTSNQSFSVGPALHYYYQIQEKLAFQVQTSFAWGKKTGSDGIFIPARFFDPYNPSIPNNQQIVVTQTTKNSSTTFAIGPGLTYFLTPHFGLQGNLLYKVNRVDPSDGNYNYGITKTSGLYFNVGLQIFLGK